MGVFSFFRKNRTDIPAIPALRDDTPTVEITPSANENSMRLTAFSSTHIGTREYQQDAVYTLCEPERVVGIVCDGMGGLDDGGKASTETLEFLLNHMTILSANDDIPTELERLIHDANKRLLDTLGSASSGTTAAAVLILGEELFWVSVGDSRIYIIREGEMVQVTRDHNFGLSLNELVKTGRMTDEEVLANPKREALISYIGAPIIELMDVSRQGFPLKEGDTVLICSDGLYKTLTDTQILEILNAYKAQPDEAARMLPLIAFDNAENGQDNTSVVIISVT